MTKPRPVCVHCGNVYGERQVTREAFIWHKDAPRPQYRGNKLVVRETMMHTAPHNVTGGWRGTKYGPDDNIADRTLWDGETWIARYKPFCTLRCALDYARKAYAKVKS